MTAAEQRIQRANPDPKRTVLPEIADSRGLGNIAPEIQHPLRLPANEKID
jgi:hypothetical protein